MEDILIELEKMTGMDVKKLLDNGLISKKQATRWIIKQRYFEMYKSGRTYFDVKNELSVIYGMSVSAIEKMIYRK